MNSNSDDKTIKVRLYKNNTPTAAAAPYIGRVVNNDTVSEDDIAASMAEDYPNIDELTVKLVISTMMRLIGEYVSKGYKVVLPTFGTFEPHITGTFDSVDAPMTPGRNKLVVKITPSAELRNDVKKLKCEVIDAPQSDLAINGVETPSLGRAGVDVVSPGAELMITGRGFGDGTLTAGIVDAEGARHVVALAQVKSLYAQGTAPAGLAAGEARLVLTLADDDDCEFTVSRKITVVS